MRTKRARKIGNPTPKAWVWSVIGIVACIFAAVTAVFFITTDQGQTTATATEDDTLPVELTIDGAIVTAGEFRYALGEVAQTVIASCGSGETAIGSDFWRGNTTDCAPEPLPTPRSDIDRAQSVLTASYSAASQELCKDSDHPKERAVCEAVRLLEQQHSAYQQAVAGGQMERGTWEEVLTKVRETNAANESARSAGQTVYGISSYDLPIFMSAYFSQLRDAYIHTESAPGMNVTDDEVRQHYQENTWDFGTNNESLESESDQWNTISTSVKEDLRTKIYYNLLAARVQSMNSVADQSSLVAFTEDALSN